MNQTEWRRIRGTNIRVTSEKSLLTNRVPVKRKRQQIAALEISEPNATALRLLGSIGDDDSTEREWYDSLRPQKNMVKPADAFTRGLKQLRPATQFVTFDPQRRSERRVARQQYAQEAIQRRRDTEVAPEVQLRRAPNPHALPRGEGRNSGGRRNRKE